MKGIKIIYDKNGSKAVISGYRVITGGEVVGNDLQLMMALMNPTMSWLVLDSGRLDVNKLK